MALNWQPAPFPHNVKLQGKYVKIYPMTIDHADDFFHNAHHPDLWTYLFSHPPKGVSDIQAWIEKSSAPATTMMLAIEKIDDDNIEGGVCGTASFLAVNTEHGSIEVGNIIFTPMLQGTIAATEAMYLMMQWAFENGYRRYEWKCNNNNAKSKGAAERFGFSYEGLFRNHNVSKDENRDTAWFSIIDSEWADIDRAFITWLSDNNFTSDGGQKQSLRTLTAPIIKAKYPR